MSCSQLHMSMCMYVTACAYDMKWGAIFLPSVNEPYLLVVFRRQEMEGQKLFCLSIPGPLALIMLVSWQFTLE